MNPTTSFPQKIEATPSQEVPSTTSSQQVTLTISTQQATSSTSTLQVTPTTSSYHATSAVFSRQVIPTRSSQQAGSISALTTTSSSDTTSLIANTLTSPPSPQPSTSSLSHAHPASDSGSSKMTNVILGICLGVVVAILLTLLWIRRQRKERRSARDGHQLGPAVTCAQDTRFSTQEKDAVAAPSELSSGRERWELTTEGRWELPAGRR